MFSYIYKINSRTQIRLRTNSSKIEHFAIKTTITFTSQLIQKINFSQQFRIQTFILTFVQHLPSLKTLLMTNQTIVQQKYKTSQIMMLHYPQHILDILKFRLQMKIIIIKYLILTL